MRNGAEAVKWARRDAELRPSPVTDDTLAWALYVNGETREAERVVDRELPRISAPALITHGRHDRTVDVANAPHIMDGIASTDKHLIWFERSGHAITVDLEHEALFATVLDWLNAH